jgi:hypothetical protein
LAGAAGGALLPLVGAVAGGERGWVSLMGRPWQVRLKWVDGVEATKTVLDDFIKGR